MFRLVVVSALLAFVAAASPKVRPLVPMLDGRIVGGKDTTIEEFPHQLSLQYRGKHMCGASILSATRALTAAHCTYETSTYDMSVRAGSTNRESGGVTSDIRKVYQHPNYNHATVDYDVSVLVLSRTLSLSNSIKPIGLHGVGEALAPGDLATVSGWGILCDNCAGLPKTLKMIQLPKVADDVCQERFNKINISPRMVCHGYDDGGKDACQGDSGGPLVVGNVQVGIVSWGFGCAKPKYPGVFTRIAHAEISSYIKENM